jgi:hypothetical protein
MLFWDDIMIFCDGNNDNRFFSVKKESKLLIGPKQFFFLSLTVEKENKIVSSENNVPKYHPGLNEKNTLSNFSWMFLNPNIFFQFEL